MRYVQAIISLGLFGWAAYAVLTDSFPKGDGGSGKSRTLKALADAATDRFGILETAGGLLAIGLLLAAFFIVRGRS